MVCVCGVCVWCVCVWCVCVWCVCVPAALLEESELQSGPLQHGQGGDCDLGLLYNHTVKVNQKFGHMFPLGHILREDVSKLLAGTVYINIYIKCVILL